MAVSKIDIETFLKLRNEHPVIDVRSEAEFEHAHIPGAISLPLFKNEERKVVGTAYKQESKQKAIKIGLQFLGTKLVDIVEKVEKIFENNKQYNNSKTVIVHCWRGGMRSGGVGWLLDLYGFKIYTIVGGYKAFRQWCNKQFENDYAINIIGGYTGSGKTFVIDELRKQNAIAIDLEDLAKHKGSAFGSIGMPAQPPQEMFENVLALELKKANESCRNKDDGWQMTDDTLPPSSNNSHQSTTIWLEDESQRIGLVNLPSPFYKTIRNKPVYFLDVPFEERLNHIVEGYGKGDKEKLITATLRIQKRLGGLETKNVINFLIEDNIIEASRILLKYYDKQYLKGLHIRQNLNDLLYTVECETVNAAANAKKLIDLQTEKTNA